MVSRIIFGTKRYIIYKVSPWLIFEGSDNWNKVWKISQLYSSILALCYKPVVFCCLQYNCICMTVSLNVLGLTKPVEVTDARYGYLNYHTYWRGHEMVASTA